MPAVERGLLRLTRKKLSRRKQRTTVLLGILGMLLSGPILAATAGLKYHEQTLSVAKSERTVRIPDGFSLELLTTDLAGPRLLTFADNGDLFIGSQSGKVYRLPLPYTRPEILIALSDYPHSVAFRPGEILIAKTSGLYRAPYAPGQSHIAKRDLSLLAALPGGGGHSSRTVAVGPDGRVYASLGISHNCSDQYLGPDYSFDEQRGGVLVLREEHNQARWETYASGLRNPIGFDWHPETGVLYASNNGPDHWGYELPPEYFSKLLPGSFHGMPWFQYDGQNIKQDDCIDRAPPRPQKEVGPPVATFPARTAPVGVTFVPKGALDENLTGDAIVALHGSWATLPSGGHHGNPATRRPPKVVVVRFENGEGRRVDDLITGFQLQDGERWARPVGVAIGPDGALYFTSDAGTDGLFRLQRSEKKEQPAPADSSAPSR
jgi:Glucose/sorbosone dehydrogenases